MAVLCRHLGNGSRIESYHATNDSNAPILASASARSPTNLAVWVIRVSASMSEKIVNPPCFRASSVASFARLRGMPFLQSSFTTDSASAPSFSVIALVNTRTKPSRRSSRLATSDSMIRRTSDSPSWTLAVCFRVNSTISTASQTHYCQKLTLRQNGGFAHSVGDGAVWVGKMVPAVLSFASGRRSRPMSHESNGRIPPRADNFH